MNKKLIRNIVFSKSPLKSHFKHLDNFQLIPCDYYKAPNSELVDDIPLIIEYWIDDSETINVSEKYTSIKNFLSQNAIQTNKLKKLLRLISSITNHRLDIYSEGLKWGFEYSDSVDFSNTASKPTLNMYLYPDLGKDMRIAQFSEQNHPDPSYITHQEYYIMNPVDNRSKAITFPDSIHIALSNYFSLDSKSQDIIDSTAHLICNGIDLKPKMKSISFLTFVSAIETLVAFVYEKKIDTIEYECKDCKSIKKSHVQCKTCGKPIWGISTQFREFLKNYVSNSKDSIKLYNDIYNLRSKIVHKGRLLLGDKDVDWSESTSSSNQMQLHFETMQVARLSLINWLLYNGEIPTHHDPY